MGRGEGEWVEGWVEGRMYGLEGGCMSGGEVWRSVCEGGVGEGDGWEVTWHIL